MEAARCGHGTGWRAFAGGSFVGWAGSAAAFTAGGGLLRSAGGGVAAIEALEDRTLLSGVSVDLAAIEPRGFEDQGGAPQPLRFLVFRDATAGDLDVWYRVDPAGTAIAGVDFLSLPGVVRIADGDNSAWIDVTPIADAIPELDETVGLDLLPGPGYSSSSSGGGGTIGDQPTVYINATDASAYEPDDNSGKFTVTRTGDTSGELIVYYSVATASTAIKGTDFELVTNDNPAVIGGVKIPAGQSTADIFVDPINDSLVEADETVIVEIDASSGYDIGNPDAGTVTIVDDDGGGGVPTITVTTDAHGAELGTNTGRFLVSRGSDTSGALTVHFSLGGTAAADVDYDDPGGSVTIPDGAGSAYVYVPVIDDNTVEGTETVVLTLTDDAGYDLGTPQQATVNIADDDARITVAATDSAAGEYGPDPGRFTLTRSQFTGQQITVGFSVTGTAVYGSGEDYTSNPAFSENNGVVSGTVTFGSGETTKVIDILPEDDDTVEADETVVITITAGGAGADYEAGTPASATVTISDDDARITIAATDADASENGPGTGTFTITRAEFLARPLTVNFQVAGTASYGAAGDYTSNPAFNDQGNGVVTGSVQFNTGQTTNTIEITPVDDLLVEAGETVVVTITAGADYEAGPPDNATVTIADNDLAAPAITGPPDPTTDTTPEITWTSIAAATSYDLLVYENGLEIVNETGISGTSYEVTPPRDAPASFTAYVQASSTTKRSQWSDPHAFDLILPAPPIITGPASPTADCMPTVTWTPPDPPADTFQMQVYHLGVGQLVYNEEGLTGSQHEIAAALTTANYRVYMRSANTELDYGGWSDPYDFVLIPPGQPTITAPADPATDRTPTVEWDPVAGGDSYDLLMYSLETGREAANASGIEATAYTVTQTLDFARYQTFVRAVNCAGEPGLWGLHTFEVIDGPPMAFDDSTTTTPDTPVRLSPMANDSDSNPEDYLAVVDVQPGTQGGTTAIVEGYFVDYTPPAGFVGVDTFTYTIEDTFGQQDSATVTVTVEEDTNNPPTAVDDSATANRDTPALIDVLLNDTDPDADDVIRLSDVQPGSMGGITIVNGGQVQYTPPPGFAGTETFDYTIDDSFGGQDTGTVTVTVENPANTAPAAADDAVSTSVDMAISIAVLINDSDPDPGDAITVSAVQPGSAGGVTTLDGDIITYIPPLGFVGVETFDYTIQDEYGLQDTATVTVTVQSSNNRPPVALADEFFVPIASTDVVVIDVLANDYDPEGGSLTIVGVSPPSEGTATTDGSFIYYQPPADPSNGSIQQARELAVTFTYQVAVAGAGAVAAAQVKNQVADILSRYATFSRGNDDPSEHIYETAKLNVKVSATHSTNKVKIEYTATISAASEWGNTGEYEAAYVISQHMLYLQEKEGADGQPLDAGANEVELKYNPIKNPDPGVGSTVTGELVVHTFEEDAKKGYMGKAVIQMRVRYPDGVWKYGPVRETITWYLSVTGKGKDERFVLNFKVREVPVPPKYWQGRRRIPTSLRDGKHNLYVDDTKKGTKQTPYPQKGMATELERDPANETRPKPPPANWDTRIPNDG